MTVSPHCRRCLGLSAALALTGSAAGGGLSATSSTTGAGPSFVSHHAAASSGADPAGGFGNGSLSRPLTGARTAAEASRSAALRCARSSVARCSACLRFCAQSAAASDACERGIDMGFNGSTDGSARVKKKQSRHIASGEGDETSRSAVRWVETRGSGIGSRAPFDRRSGHCDPWIRPWTPPGPFGTRPPAPASPRRRGVGKTCHEGSRA